MKKLFILLILGLLTMLAAACANPPDPAAAEIASTAEIAPAAKVADAEPTVAVQPEEEPAPEKDGDLVVMREKMFIAQFNDIMFNHEDYVGKTIKVEGMYQEFIGNTSGIIYHYVNRNSPGCCGNDGSVGFEFLYDGETPVLNDWIEVVGTLEYLEQGGVKFLVIRAEELNVLAVRGAEFVYN